jgi:hypothetical protein
VIANWARWPFGVDTRTPRIPRDRLEPLRLAVDLAAVVLPIQNRNDKVAALLARLPKQLAGEERLLRVGVERREVEHDGKRRCAVVPRWEVHAVLPELVKYSRVVDLDRESVLNTNRHAWRVR